MSDKRSVNGALCERLRGNQPPEVGAEWAYYDSLMREAADEIERLRKQVDCLTNGNLEQGCGHEH